MNKSMKAVLLSALILPGIGHLYLKRYLTGAVLACTAIIALYFLLSMEIERALGVLEKIELGEVQPNLEAITELVSRQSVGSDGQTMNIISIILLCSWVIGIVGSYMAGRKKDNNPETN